jgi:hypothetical protein
MYKRAKSTSTMGDSGSKEPDRSGVEFGLSSLSEFDSANGGLQADMSHNSKTGNYPGRPKVNPTPTSGKEKGKSFTIC